METFVREAIARAAFERAESEKEGAAGGGWSGGFLEVSYLKGWRIGWGKLWGGVSGMWANVLVM